MKRFLNLNLPFPNKRSIVYESVFLTVYILFVLFLFQPFGTDRYDNPYKSLQLAGYGLLVFVSYPLLKRIFLLFKPTVYTIKHEVFVLTSCFLLLIFNAFCYHGFVIEETFQWKHLLTFAWIGLVVMILPFLALLYKAYVEVRSQVSKPSPANQELEIKGINLGEHFYFNVSDVFYLRSNGNYVIIYFQKEGALKHEMLRSTLGQVVSQVSATDFMAIHRSFMVNVSKFDKLIKENGKAVLLNKQFDIRLPVSKSNLEYIEKKLKDHR